MFAILIPAFNEEQTIELIVRESLLVTRHVFVIDDGSSDKTKSLAQRNNAVVLENETNKGLGYSLNKGLRMIFSQGYKSIVTLDGDGAHLPSEAPSLVKYNKETNADITIGSRLSVKKVSDFFPSPKMSANILGSLLLQKYCNINLSDIASGMRVVNSNYLELPELSTGFGFTFDLLCIAQKNNLVINDFPISVRYDAREPFVTQIPEIIALSNTILKFSTSDRDISNILTFIDLIKNEQTFQISVDKRHFYFFPIPIYNSYLCQEQHQDFTHLNNHVPILEI